MRQLTSRLAVDWHNDIEFGTRTIVNDRNKPSSLILNDANSKMLIPHAIDAHRCSPQPVQNLRPGSINVKLDKVFDAQLMSKKSQLVDTLRIRVITHTANENQI
ncbi:hypothetical protein HG530_012053 [Fusarium avenaceum]|nr:hypothetical protein HG530_012053 [Fusarium avenaceum]